MLKEQKVGSIKYGFVKELTLNIGLNGILVGKEAGRKEVDKEGTFQTRGC